MADHSLKPAIHRSLGRPLPYQLANGPRTHLITIAVKKRPSFPAAPEDAVGLSGISTPFEVLSQTLGQVIHVLLTRAPLYSESKDSFLVRLACVRHAASVRSEPGSNSPVIFLKFCIHFCSIYLNLTSSFKHLLFSFQRPDLPLRQCVATSEDSIQTALLCQTLF